MKRLLAALRTLLWLPLNFLASVLCVLFALATLPFPGVFLRVPRLWARSQRWLARGILGQRVEIEGVMPPAPAFVVLKHEAMWETVDIMLLLDRPVVFAKAELFSIPFWGRLARHYGLIAIERDAGASALRQMRSAARTAHAAGRPLALYPEGTRVPPGEAPAIRAGFAGLYKLLALPVVPVAVASGHLKEPGGWIRWPGVIRYRIGAEIPAGLPREEAESRAHAALNALNGPDRLTGRSRDGPPGLRP